MTWATLNGGRVISGSITIPWWGAIVADVTLSDSIPLPSASILTIGDLSINSTVVRAANFAGSRSARLVGGAGGWRKTLLPRAYAVGATTAMILNDAAIEVGEKVVVATPKPLGMFVRASQYGATLLRNIAASLWYVDPLGVTQVGVPRLATPILSPFTVEEYSGGKGRLRIATETPSDWMPGRTFTTPTITTPLTVSTVRHDIDNDGAVRMEVLTTSASPIVPDADRLTVALRQFIQNTFERIAYMGVTEFAVQVVDVGTSQVELLPTSTTPIASVPPLAIPLAAYTNTGGATPTIGDTCLVAFVNGDPSRPTLIPRVGDAVLDGAIAWSQVSPSSVSATYTGPDGSVKLTTLTAAGVSGVTLTVTGALTVPIKGAIGVGA